MEARVLQSCSYSRKNAKETRIIDKETMTVLSETSISLAPWLDKSIPILSEDEHPYPNERGGGGVEVGHVMRNGIEIGV